MIKIRSRLQDFFNSNRPGHVWSVRKIAFSHVGIETSRGTIIAASPQTHGVAEISKTDFADNQVPQDAGYPGDLPASEVENRAFALIGKRYSFMGDNCEHLVTEAHGLGKHSPQLQMWMTAAAIGALVYWLGRRARI